MKIKTVKSYLHEMRLKEPYEIAYQTFDTAKNVFVEIHTESGLTGFGCAAPDEEVTAETPEKIMQQFDEVIPEILLGKDVFRFSHILADLWDKIPYFPGAIAAVDIALHDLIGKICRLPLWKWLGVYREKILTSITIGILPEDETVRRAQDFVKQGFLSLKIKGGKNVDEDLARIFRVREVIGKHVSIRFDANQGYAFSDALKFIKEAEKANIELLEQPVDKNDVDSLNELAKRSFIPIMADESIVGAEDMLNLACRKSVHGANLKLMKNGGIVNSTKMTAIAETAKLSVMIGCMDESALGIAAGLHFALSQPNVRYADLDGHFDLIDDPFADLVNLENGYLFPTSKHGLTGGSAEKFLGL